MLISLRTKLFDTAASCEEERYRGKDFAKWLQLRMSAWDTEVIGEDWGWAVVAGKDIYRYIFGVYDHDAGDENELGSRWVLRLYNRRDRSNWFKKIFTYIPPKAHPEIVDEIVYILESNEDIHDVQVMPID